MLRDGNERKRFAPAILLVLLALLTPLGILLQWLFPAISRDASSYYAAVILQQLLLWLLPAFFLRPWRHRRLGPKGDICLLTLLAAPAGAMIQLFAAQLRQLVPVESGAAAVLLPSTGTEWALASLALVILPAVCEQAFFRGSLTGHLLDTLKPPMAFAVSVLLFALMHGSMAGLPAHMLISMLCTLLMMATGRLWAPVLAHLGFNAAALAVPYLSGSPWLLAALIPPVCLMLYLIRRQNWEPREGLGPCGTAEKLLLGILLAAMCCRYFI